MLGFRFGFRFRFPGGGASRRREAAVRPKAEALEGRISLSAGAVGPRSLAARSTLARPTLEVENGGVVSQRDDLATVVVRLPSVPWRFLRINSVTYDVVTLNEPAGLGAAVAGRHFQPIRQSVTFAPGDLMKTVSVPVVSGAENPGQLRLTVRAEPRGSVPVGPRGPRLGSAEAEVTLDRRADVIAPRASAARLIVADGRVQGIAVTFNELMDRATVEDVNRYIVHDHTYKPGIGDWVGAIVSNGDNDPNKTTAVPLERATYDPDTRTLTLITTRPLKPDGEYLVGSKPIPRPRRGVPATPANLPIDLSNNMLTPFRVGIGRVNKSRQAAASATKILDDLPHL